MVTSRLENLIQYSDFIQGEKDCDYTCWIVRKMKSPLKFIARAKKKITNEMKRKGDTVLTTSKKIAK